jgi:predicted MPP superfamily phosphohydrolase
MTLVHDTELQPAAPHQDSHWHIQRGMVRPQPQRHTEHPRSHIEPRRVHVKRWWAALGLLPGAVALQAVQRHGWPATLGLSLLAGLGAGYVRWFEPTHPTLERQTFRFRHLPAALDGLRIGQISDLHLGLPYAANNLRWALEQLQREKPDLIVITGDAVHCTRAIPEVVALLRGINAPLGVFAVPGNHDYWEGIDDLNGAYALLGIDMLCNTARQIQWNGASFWLAGVDDMWEGDAKLNQALAGIPTDQFTVLLAHAPDIADEASHSHVALQLSGHTHGGHLRLPRMGPFAKPRFGLRYVMGRYQVGQLQVYVARGLGGKPLRLFCRPEATIITLRHG